MDVLEIILKILWAGVTDILEIIMKILFCGSAVTGAIVSVLGLSAWRKQLKGKTEYELAKQVLKIVYELREAIAGVRHPFLRHPEEPDLPEEELRKMSTEKKRWKAHFQVYEKRWEAVFAARSSLIAVSLDVEVVWGEVLIGKLDPLYKKINELRFAIDDYFGGIDPDGYHHPRREGQLKDSHNVMYSRMSLEKDNYRKELEDIISSIEKELKPHIKKYHS
jgi:hypothetical protein